MGKLRKRRVRWNAARSGDVVGYRLYWKVGQGVNYDSDFAEVGDRTEVILPDDIPSFPLVTAEMDLGVTAVSNKGNESDMVRFSAPFEFTVPDAPTDLSIETIEDFWWTPGQVCP